MAFMKSKGSNFVMWVIMALLIVGLGGFGLTGAFQGASGSAIATVGKQEVTAQTYYTAVQRNISQMSQQFGVPISIEQARLAGIDQSTLRQLIGSAVLADQADQLTLSVGNSAVRSALLGNPEFQGLTGAFSEETYDFALNQQNLSRAEYETSLRESLIQNLIAQSVASGPLDTVQAAETLMAYLGETRSILWVVLDPADVIDTIEAPDEAAIQQFYDDNPGLFTLPETRQITYVALTPDMVVETISVDESLINAEYEARTDQYNIPASRIIDRIVFGTDDEAQTAMDQISTGEADFDMIAQARGLIASDIAVGLVLPSQVSPAEREALFATSEPGVIGPVETALGPALFRVNAVIAAQTTPLEEVHDEIARSIAMEQAQEVIAGIITHVEDLVAGGATLEEIAEESDMQLGTLDFSGLSEEEIAQDPQFRQEATEAQIGEERDLRELENRGIFVLRLDGITPEMLQPLADARQIAIDGAIAVAAHAKLLERAETFKSLLENGADFAGTMAASNLEVYTSNNIARNAPEQQLPANAAQGLFDQAAGETAIYQDQGLIYLVQVSRVDAFDPEIGSNGEVVNQVEERLSEGINNDIFSYYANTLINRADITVNQAMIEQLLSQLR